MFRRFQDLLHYLAALIRVLQSDMVVGELLTQLDQLIQWLGQRS